MRGVNPNARLSTRVGTLRHRVTIEQPVRRADDGGGAEISWQPLTTVWAQVLPNIGQEVFEGDQLGGRITHDIRMRWRGDIAPNMRITHRGKLYDIRYAVNLGGLNQWLICQCEETTA